MNQSEQNLELKKNPMEVVNNLFNEIISMGFKNSHEAKDMLIALYGSYDKSVLADVSIQLENYYG